MVQLRLKVLKLRGPDEPAPIKLRHRTGFRPEVSLGGGTGVRREPGLTPEPPNTVIKQVTIKIIIKNRIIKKF